MLLPSQRLAVKNPPGYQQLLILDAALPFQGQVSWGVSHLIQDFSLLTENTFMDDFGKL